MHARPLITVLTDGVAMGGACMSVTVDAPTRGPWPWPWLARLFGRGRTDAEMYTMVGPVA